MFLSFPAYGKNGDDVKKILRYFLLMALLLCLCYGSTCIKISSQSLTLWFENLVPSMFVTMVLIRLLYKQQMLQHLVPDRICHIFGLDQSSFALVISSMLLGFPNGSLFIEEAFKRNELDRQSAHRLFLICCFPTPGFVILSCGIGLYHNAKIGFYLYLSSLLYGFLMLWLTRSNSIHTNSVAQHTTNSFMQDFSASLLESGTSLFMIGGYLMIFMSVTGIVFSFLPALLSLPLRICAEFSSGVFLIQASSMSYIGKLLSTSALLGFGGLCVHMQIFSMCDTCKTKYHTFFFFRILQSIISVLIFCIFLYLFV